MLGTDRTSKTKERDTLLLVTSIRYDMSLPFPRFSFLSSLRFVKSALASATSCLSPSCLKISTYPQAVSQTALHLMHASKRGLCFSSRDYRVVFMILADTCNGSDTPQLRYLAGRENCTQYCPMLSVGIPSSTPSREYNLKSSISLA
jgi:hypothetical protein